VGRAFDISADTGTPVDDRDYQVPFKLTIKLDRPSSRRKTKSA
jgi:hypothetical protein